MIGKDFFPTSLTPPRDASATREKDVLNILIVDDIPDILYYFQGVLRRIRGTEFRLTIEANSNAALERVKNDPFDLVITDFRMKGATGLEILHAAYGRNPEGLRVLMTGYNEIPATLEEIRSANVDGYLQKPLSAHDLLLLLSDLLRGNEKALGEMRDHARELEDIAEKEERGADAPAAFVSSSYLGH